MKLDEAVKRSIAKAIAPHTRYSVATVYQTIKESGSVDKAMDAIHYAETMNIRPIEAVREWS